MLTRSVSRFMMGFSSPLEGAQVIFSSKKNMTFAILPFLIGAFFVVVGFVTASQYLQPWLSQWTESSDFLKDWSFIRPVIDFLLLLFTWIIVSVANFIAGYICIIVVGGPFYALMVENLFKTELGEREGRSSLKLMLTMFLTSLMKILVFALIGLFCFILAFIPGFNLLATFVLVLLVAFDCSDYAFEVDLLKLRERFRFLLSHLMEYTGLSVAILLTGFLPGSFFILLPIFICGATKMYIQLNHKTV